MVHIYTGKETQPWAQTAELIQEARDRNTPVIVIVPQQYTLAAERALIHQLGTKGFFDVDVVSPLRFSQRVFNQAGCDERTRIDAFGKAMAVSRAIMSEEAQLRFYGQGLDRQGFIDQISQMIGDLKRSRISPPMFEAFQSALPEGALADKYHDLALIYKAYETILSGQFVDGEDVQAELLRRLADAEMVQQARIIAAGFDLITEDLGSVLTALSSCAESVHIVITEIAEQSAYAPVADSVLRMEQSLREHGIELRYHPMRDAFARPQEILYLHDQFLQSPYRPYPASPQNIRLYASPTPYAEACRVAEEILVLHAEGMDWNDILILTAEEDKYFSALEHALNIYRIPHHLARKTAAAQMGPARFLLDALTAVLNGYRQSDMLKLIKNDYLPLTSDERYRLENVIVQYGINHYKFNRPFTAAKEEGILLEEARLKMMAALEALKTGMAQAQSIDDIMMAWITYLNAHQAFEHMNDDADALEAQHRLTEAAQLRQVWNCLMNLLDQMHDILGDSAVKADEAATMLTTGLSQAEIASLPQESDAVACGVIGRIAVYQPKVVFVMGLNDGAISSGDNGLITDEEQDLLKNSFRSYSAMNQDQRQELKQLELMKSLYAPSQRLYLSHAQSLQDGTALRPLDLLLRIRRIFPLLLEEGGVTAPQGPGKPYAVMAALESIGSQMRDGQATDQWLQAWRYLSEAQPESIRKLCDAYRPMAQVKALPQDLVHQLYLERVTSIHRLESFAVCPFRHYLQYIIKPVQRTSWAINRTDTGAFYHRALEGFTRSLQNLPEWPDVTRAEVERLMERSADEALDELMTGVMGDSSVQKREYRQYKRLLRRVGWTFTLIAQHSQFRVRSGEVEVRFGYPDDGLPAIPLRLSDGSRVYVRGIIDRIERYEGDDGVAIRLIDLKTPNLTLKPEKVYWGAQLQLLLYMQAVLNAEPQGIPAGLYYFHLADPLLEATDLKSDIESNLAKALSLRGLTLRDASIIRLMDDGKPPLSLPPLLKSDGDFSQNKTLATLEEMRLLIQHAENVAAHLAESINSGNITASPLTVPNEESPCAHCDAYDICRRNANNNSIVERDAGKFDFDELIERIRTEE